MQDIALRGLTSDASAEDFDSSWWFRPFGLEVQAVFELFPEAIRRAQEVTLLGELERRAARPLDSTEPEGKLFAWPTMNNGLAMLLERQKGQWALTGCWPFLASGSEHDAVIETVLLSPSRLQAMVEARIGEDLALIYHDFTFAATRGLYVKGVDHRLVLAGIAHTFGPADTTPIKIGPDAPSFAALSRGGQAVGDDGMITILTTGMAAIFPRGDIAPNVYEFRGPVVQVRKTLNDMFDQPVWLVRVTVARIGAANDVAVNLDIAVTATVLDGRPLPGAGDEVQGVILLQGRIWLPAINANAPEPASPSARRTS